MRRRFSLPVLALIACSALAGPASADGPGTREGPFVMTDRTLSSLLADGYEIRGLMASSMILVKEAELYSCAVVADQEALAYKPYFACSVLDEIAPDRGTDAGE